jgi:hypothetical protein
VLELLVLAGEFLVEVLQLLFLRLEVRFRFEDALGDTQVGLQFGNVQRLVQEGVRARLQRLQFVLFLPARRKHHQVGVMLAGMLANCAAEFDAIHVWHLPVGDHDGRWRVLVGFPRLRAVLRRHDLVPHLLEVALQQFPRHDAVFGNQHPHSITCLAGGLFHIAGLFSDAEVAEDALYERFVGGFARDCA